MLLPTLSPPASSPLAGESIIFVALTSLVMASPTPQAKSRKSLAERVAEGRAKGLNCNADRQSNLVLAGTGMLFWFFAGMHQKKWNYGSN
ncbi:hypothetical protein PspLS_11415 [Pyricularia sp. CBS 133598]|nr:hypothetical protein PspLS_11415 [Pyricularia sp. CBS 133598]